MSTATALQPTECTFQHYVPCVVIESPDVIDVIDFFTRGLHTRTAVARFPQR